VLRTSADTLVENFHPALRRDGSRNRSQGLEVVIVPLVVSEHFFAGLPLLDFGGWRKFHLQLTAPA
jgi:hypothetical protein